MGTRLMYSDNGSLVPQQLSWNHATFRTLLGIYMGSDRLNCQLYIEVSLVMKLDNVNTYHPQIKQKLIIHKYNVIIHHNTVHVVHFTKRLNKNYVTLINT